ncbi:MAG: hypothetical protein V3U80_05635 [Flavobacteriaceae bacterium]
MNTIKIINEYDRIMDGLADAIKNSPYKIQYFLDLLDLKRGFFYKKLKEKRFTSEEMKVLSKSLYPEEYKDYEVEMIDKLLGISQQEFRDGKGEDFEPFLRESMRKYGL